MLKKDKHLPKISIIMPCFNSANFIERSIRSVIEQDYNNLELIIQDGGSQDGSVEIIKYYTKKYPSKIIWTSKKDRGQADAINKGFEKATGEIMTYLNADDIYKKGALATVAKYFLEHPNIMWLYSRSDIIDSEDKQIRGWITAYKNFWLKHYSYNTLLILNYISQMSCFWRKEAAHKIGKFDINQHYVMDYDYWLRLGKLYKPGVILQYLSSFRITYTNKSSTGFLKQFSNEFQTAKIYTNNPIILLLHKIHYFGIVGFYSVMRVMR